MGEQLQQQLNTLLRIVQEERETNASEREKIHARLDALSHKLIARTERTARTSPDQETPRRAGSNRSETAAEGATTQASTVPKFAKLS